jgi:hypothetical protein
MAPAASSTAAAASVALHLASAASPAPPWWAQGIWTSELAKGLPAAVVALLIGGVAAAIAWRQARIAGAKLKLDLFDRRFALYIELRDFLGYASGEGLDSNDLGFLGRMRNTATSARFLFGSAIGADFDEAYLKAVQLRQAYRALRATDFDDPGRQAAEAKVSDLLGWFADRLKGQRARFAKYMDFENWH